MSDLLGSPNPDSNDTVTLANDQISATFGVARGCDLLALVDPRTDVNALFVSPWVERARDVARHGPLLLHPHTAYAWLEGYQGGMQVLCPNAGGPDTLNGVEHSFHGEASVIPWRVVRQGATEAEFEVTLFTAPLTIHRVASVAGPVLRIVDTVTNTAPLSIDFHYQYHPAFGRPLAEPGAIIETGAQVLNVDPNAEWTPLPTGESFPWPPEVPGHGMRLDRLPEPDNAWSMLGWLSDFVEPWVAIRNERLDLGVVMRWDADTQPNAWLWQEFGQAVSYPWYGRAYAVAIEPSDTTTSGTQRARHLSLDAGQSLTVPLTLALTGGTRVIGGMSIDGQIRFADQ